RGRGDCRGIAGAVRHIHKECNAEPGAEQHRGADEVNKLENQDGGGHLSITRYSSCCRPSKTHVNALMARRRRSWRSAGTAGGDVARENAPQVRSFSSDSAVACATSGCVREQCPDRTPRPCRSPCRARG